MHLNAPPKDQPTIFGHPVGLYVLFFTEMWERFSYYGMRSLLILYMVDHLFLRPDVGQKVLGFTILKSSLESIFGPLTIQPLSSQIYGLYTAFVYLTPFFGGMLADRILGQRKTVILGAVLMAIGQFLMTVENLFFVALIFLITGNGAFKPNISTQVGGLYPEGDARRDGAFTIFYMGINLGATLSPLVCGTLGQMVGWRYGFAASGVGMVLGLIFYLWGCRFLGSEATVFNVEPVRAVRFIALYIVGTVGGLMVILILLPNLLGRLHQVFRILIPSIAGILFILYVIRWMRQLPPAERGRVGALVTLCAINILFWGGYEQTGNTMQLWADRNTNWTFAGITIPSTWYQSFNSIIIFVFAPLLTMFWTWQARRHREPSSVTKMAIGCYLLGLSFIIMILAAQRLSTPEERLSMLWLWGMTFILTIGELYLSPIGLSLVTKVSPPRIVSMMMGIWFLSNFFGNYLSGYLGTYWGRMSHEAFFLMLTLLGIGAGIAISLVNRPVQKIVAGNERPGSSG